MGKKKVSEVVAILKKAFPDIAGIKDASEWGTYGEDTAIHLGNAAEGGEIDGYPACDYYVEDIGEEVYVMGVHFELHRLLTKHGFYVESYDPGTYLAFRSYDGKI